MRQNRHNTTRFAVLLCGLLLALPADAVRADETIRLPSSATVETCFTPGDDCTGAIIRAIGQARRRLLIQAYYFTSAPIARAVIDARKRGVDVRIILDKSQADSRYNSATFFANAGIPLAIDADVRIAHNKVMIIDGATVITGSFNFTKSAQYYNAENLLIIHGAPALAAIYEKNWLQRNNASRPYRLSHTGGLSSPQEPYGALNILNWLNQNNAFSPHR